MSFWSAFFPQLVATVVGAGIGITGVFVAFRLDRRAATADSFDVSVERLLTRIDELAADTDAWRKSFDMTNWSGGDRPPPHPHVGRVSIALEIMRLRSPVREREQIEQLSKAWDEIAQSGGDNLVEACGVFANAIVKWRGGAATAEIDNALSVARKLATAD